MLDRNMEVFLSLVPLAGWRQHVPPTWNDQFREALSGGLIEIGWGGLIELTELGERSRVTK